MNTGQIMLTLGAMVLLSLVIIRVNTGFLNTGSVLMESKFGVLATSLATSLIEEANGKAFDQFTDTSTVDDVNDLSVLGPDSAEVYPAFNDFDDFNGLTIIDSTMPSAIFKIECNVNYVTPAAPNTASVNKTWHKRISVIVSSQSMNDSVKMSSIFSYFHYR